METTEAGAPTAPEAPPRPWTPGSPRPMLPDDMTAWNTRAERAEQLAKTFWPQWQRSLDRYAKAKVNEPTDADDINALLDYRHVESKKAQLAFDTPEINLIPPDQADPAIPVALLPLREKFLNDDLGPDKANMIRALHKTLIDALAASAFLITKVGYEQVTLPVTRTQPGMFGSAPVPVTLDVPVWSRRFISAVSSKKLLIPDDFADTDFDEAPWLGVRGRIARSTAKRLKWNIPDDFTGSTAKDDTLFEHGTEKGTATDEYIEYVEIWYRASLYDETVFNPELYRCLILVKGIDNPVWHVDSPYQSLTDTGELTDDSMVGNPIHVATIRDLIDSAYVPSDLVVGEQLSVELNRFRTGLMRSRRSRRPVTLISDKASKDLIEKVAANAGPVPTPDEYFDGAGSQRLIAVVGGQSEPRDNYTGQQMIEHDWQSAIGTGDNQGGSFKQGAKTTATEVRTVQGNASARAKVDENRVRAYVIALIRKYDAVVQRTASRAEVVKVLGQQGAMLWEQWRALPGKYAYKIQPDSGRYLDANEYRTQKVNEYNLLRKDPLVNGAELTRAVVTALGYDAAKLVPQDAAQEKPESPKVSFSLALDKATPVTMQFVITLMEQQGYQFSPQLKQAMLLQASVNEEIMQMEQQAKAQPSAEHGGPANKTERIDKRQESRTGGIEGVGRVA